MASVPLAPQSLPAPLLQAAAVHNRLVAAFIQLTRAELARQRDDYARDSLNELLDVLKAQLTAYDTRLARTGHEAANQP